LTPSFTSFLRKYSKDVDIIHFHHPNPTAELAFLVAGLKKKLVVTYHSDIIRQDKLGKLYSPFRHIFLRSADKIIVTSPNYLDSSKVLRKHKDKCTVITLGIDINRFRSDKDLPMVEKIRSENKNSQIILFVGCFRYYKGLHLLLMAMKNVHGKLLLIGAGPEEKKLLNIAEINNLNEKVCFLGQLSDEEVNAYYKACDIFVLPSHLRSEAFGIVQLEAMCCRKPVVSTELGTGTTFVNLNNETGLTVKPNDVDSLSDALNYLINNPNKRKRFGESGYRRAIQLFNSEKMVKDTLKLYKTITKK
jgi:rhamnosyl/mannosyltransferase